MARKATSKPTQPDAAGVIERMEFSLSIPPEPAEPRPGSAVSLEMVNVFGEPVAEGARLRLTAWVNNVSYVKHVWVDAYLLDAKGSVVLSETMVLDYYEGAGGGGDFFILDTAIPGARPPAALLAYRLYYNIGDTVYTDGILHTHVLKLTKPAAKAAATPASKAVKAAATIATAGAAAAAAAGAAKLASRTPGKTPAKSPAKGPAGTAEKAPENRAAEPGEASASAPAKPIAAAKTAEKNAVARVAPGKEPAEGDAGPAGRTGT